MMNPCAQNSHTDSQIQRSDRQHQLINDIKDFIGCFEKA